MEEEKRIPKRVKGRKSRSSMAKAASAAGVLSETQTGASAQSLVEDSDSGIDSADDDGGKYSATDSDSVVQRTCDWLTWPFYFLFFTIPVGQF